VLTFPKGTDERLRGKKVLGYNNCTLTGFEYAADATMIRAGLMREGFTVVRAISDRYDGRMRLGLYKTTWGYSGNPFGDDESGKYYARAQSAWSLLLAAQGFIYDGPAGTIGFDPVWRPDDNRSFFTGARGFGVFSQTRTDRGQACAIDVRDGTLDVERVIVHIPSGVSPVSVAATVDGTSIPTKLATADSRVAISLEQRRTLGPGERLGLALAW